MNLHQITTLQKIKSALNTFRSNHPKFPLFLKVVSQDALVAGTVIEITVTTPAGKDYRANVKLQESDLELMESLKDLR